MNFFYPFVNFFQPGVFWPALADLRPMLLLSAMAMALGLAARRATPRGEVFRHPIFVWLAVFILLQPITVLHSGLGYAVQEFLYWLNYLLFVAVSLLLMRNEAAVASYVRGMMAGALFIIGFGILAVINEWPQAVGGRAGAYGMYENHNDYSFLIIQVVPFLYMARKTSQSVIMRFLLALGLLTCAVGTLLSLSRGGMLALVLEAALIILIGMDGRKRLLWLPILAIVGAAAIGLQFAKRAENQGDNYTAADAENSRLELWTAASNMVLDKPLLGIGSRQFGEYSRDYGEISHDNRGKNTHNTYLEVLTGNGIIGFACFITLIAKLIGGLRGAAALAPTGSPFLEAMRRATLISLLSILFRALLDAKPHDWSFYTLAAIGLATILLQRTAAGQAAASTAEPAAAARRGISATRPLNAAP
ncbi:O-antigen ligase family protein [Oxalobacteraceae bacterium OM1]|nr:O-antigen ligase family protein [Oxalobacteraceae bacterium OM1]